MLNEFRIGTYCSRTKPVMWPRNALLFQRSLADTETSIFTMESGKIEVHF